MTNRRRSPTPRATFVVSDVLHLDGAATRMAAIPGLARVVGEVVA